MIRFSRRVIDFLSGPAAFPFFLLAMCLAAYAPLLPRLGFYWDDFPISWIGATMGGEGLERYFSTNRPVWGMFYRVTTALIGSNPLAWQIIGLLMRWITGLALWILLRLVWRGQVRFAAWAAVLFVIYPGFSQQFIAFMYSHFYIVLTIFLLSMVLMVLALRSRRFYWPLTAAALALSALNMFSMEYFFLLDLLRPLLIVIVLRDLQPGLPKGQLWKQALIRWLPFLAVFIGAMYWRSVLFGFHTYQPTLTTKLKSDPVSALAALILTAVQDLWMVSAGAAAKAFTLPVVKDVGERNLLRYGLIVTFAALLSAVWLLLQRSGSSPQLASQPARWSWQPVALGVAALAIAGGPFWLTGLEVGLVFPNDRFTLPFMFGFSLLIAGLMNWLPAPHWAKAAILGVFIGFTCGLHFQSAISYNRDWNTQRVMFWQMTWRIPDIEPGTVLLSNELPVTHYTDNSLSAPLNWIYDPDGPGETMKYTLFYPTIRRNRALRQFQPDQTIDLNYLAVRFTGSTSQMVTLYFNPPGCLRVLDPEVEADNWMVPEQLRETLTLSTTAPILPVPSAGKTTPAPPAHIYGGEIARGWCYAFEKADLARQFGDWETVVSLGDQAFVQGDYPNDPIERFPFIEGYAHAGRWDRALDLTREARAVTPIMQPPLCKLWQRIERETPPAPDQQNAVQSVKQELECGS